MVTKVSIRVFLMHRCAVVCVAHTKKLPNSANVWLFPRHLVKLYKAY